MGSGTFRPGDPGEQLVTRAVEKQIVRLHGKDYDIAPLVKSANSRS